MNDLQTTEPQAPQAPQALNITANAQAWELAQRQAKAFASSDLVPQAYRGNVPNCLICLEMASRLGASPLMVAQNLYIVHGNPGWSAKFLIASFNQCGRFSALRYEWNADRTACRAWAIEKSTGDRIEGPQVTVQMAKEEGWSTKSGSKWKTMPELMLMYRAAAFMIRTYAPEISMGLLTEDELHDVNDPPQHRQAGSTVTLAELVNPQEPPRLAPTADPQTGEIEGPTYAELTDRVMKAQGPDQVAEILDLARHLPADQQDELRKLSEDVPV